MTSIFLTNVSAETGFGVVTVTSSFITFEEDAAAAAGDDEDAAGDDDTKMEGTTFFLRTRLVL